MANVAIFVVAALVSLERIFAMPPSSPETSVCGALLDCYVRAIELTKNCYKTKSKELQTGRGEACDSNAVRRETISLYIADQYSKIVQCMKDMPPKKENSDEECMAAMPIVKNVKCDKRFNRHIYQMCVPLKSCCPQSQLCELMNGISPMSAKAEDAVLERLKQHKNCWWFKKLVPANSTLPVDLVFDSEEKHVLVRNVLLHL